MDRETARKTWGSIESYLQKKRGGGVSVLEICPNGIYNIYEGKEGLEAGLQNELSFRFKLTKGTPMRFG